MENRFFRYALLVSLLIHVLVFTKLPYPRKHPFKTVLRNIEITYFDITPLKKKDITEKKEKVKSDQPEKTEVRLKEYKKASSLIKDLSKLLDKFDLPKKQPADVSKLHPKRQISVPPLKSEKISNPTYQSYYQIVRSKIKERAHVNYARLDIGEVYITFIIISDGTLTETNLIDEKTSANQYLKNVSLKSVREANPFPPFPKELKYPELTFNVVISFKEVEG